MGVPLQAVIARLDRAIPSFRVGRYALRCRSFLRNALRAVLHALTHWLVEEKQDYIAWSFDRTDELSLYILNKEMLYAIKRMYWDVEKKCAISEVKWLCSRI